MPFLNRRDFFSLSASAFAAANLCAFADDSVPAPIFRTKIQKAAITGIPTQDYCELLVKAGFNGMETTSWNVAPADAAKSRLLTDKFGLRIHSVMRGWAEFNSLDEDKRNKSIEETKTAIYAASAYGADSILLVPCRIGGMKMPDPWDFKIDFDPKTLRVKSVVDGDNEPFREYIDAQNRSTEMSIRVIEELIPLAAKEGVFIALENVWNNLWVMPEFFAAFVRHFGNIWVKTYLDLGNHTRYAKPEHWVAAASDTIVKLHIKGYKIDEVLNSSGGGKGNWCKIDEANIDWLAVRKKLDSVNFNGWLTFEEGGHPLEKYGEILSRFIDGA